MQVTGRIQPDAGFLTIMGHDSTLSLAVDQSARVVEVRVTDDTKSFSLELLDVTVERFSGAFHLSGLESFKCTRVTF